MDISAKHDRRVMIGETLNSRKHWNDRREGDQGFRLRCLPRLENFQPWGLPVRDLPHLSSSASNAAKHPSLRQKGEMMNAG